MRTGLKSRVDRMYKHRVSGPCALCGGRGKHNARWWDADGNPMGDHTPDPCPACGKVLVIRYGICRRIEKLWHG
jgi:hypothetical protein